MGKAIASIRSGFAAAVALSAALAMVAPAVFAQTTLERAKDQGYIRAAFANEEPFGYLNQDNELTGESPAIAKVVLKRIGIPDLDGILTEWASLLPGLNAGRWDFVAAGMFITEERCKEADFSNPTYKLGQSFLVQQGNPKNLHSYQDVKNNPDVKLGVMAGAVEVGYARRVGIPDDQLVQLPDQASMLSAVRSGRVDAGALTALSIQRMAERGGDSVERAKPFRTPDFAVGYGAYAFRKDDDDLRRAFNRVLKDFIGSRQHLELVRPFGWTEEELPGDITAEELCGMDLD